MEKDFSLLRPFDLEAAKAGADREACIKITWTVEVEE